MSDRRRKYIRIRRRWLTRSSGARPAKRKRRTQCLRGGNGHVVNNDILSNLPVDVGQRILNKLQPVDLLRAGRVCRVWRNLVASILWQRIAQPSVTINQAKLFHLYTQSYLSWCHRPIGEAMSSVLCSTGVESMFGLFCLYFTKDGREFIMNNARCEVVTVDSSNGEILYQFKEIFSCSTYAAPIRYLAWMDIFCFDCESRECVRTLKGHKGNVLCMHVHDHLLVSGSTDCSVRLWDTASGTLLGLFLGHVAPVHWIVFKDKSIVSVSSDAVAKVWLPRSSRSVHTLFTGSGDKSLRQNLDFDGVRLVFSRDYLVEVWKVDGEVLTPLATQRLQQKNVKATSVKFIENTGCIAAGFEDGSVLIWDVGAGERVKVIRSAVQTEPGWQIQFEHSIGGFLVHYEFIVSWTRSGLVSLFDRVTGTFIRSLLNLPQDSVQGTTEAVGKIVGVCAHKYKLAIAISIGQYGSRFKMFDFTPRNI